MARLKIGVLISGRGSNLQALIAACAEPGFPARIVIVISNNPEARGLRRAQGAAIATKVVDHRTFPDRESFDVALNQALTAAGAELVCLAGFMRLLTPDFVTHWRDRLINVHPSLLPSFKGLHVHERTLEAGVRLSGCSVHFVRPEMDSGPIIVQAAVPVADDDTAESLAQRILAAEHRCYPLALRLIAERRVRVVDEVVRISGAQASQGVLINPAP